MSFCGGSTHKIGEKGRAGVFEKQDSFILDVIFRFYSKRQREKTKSSRFIMTHQQ
jgi:hypothetical protein